MKGIKTDWEAIRQGYMLGETADSLSARFRVKAGTIRCRASREGWITPRNLEEKLNERKKEIDEQVKDGLISSAEGKKMKSTVEQTALAITDQREAHKSAIMKLVNKGLEKSKLPAIKTWKDAKIADDMARRALDMDLPDEKGSIINIGILGDAVIDHSSNQQYEDDEADE